jgi:hypothetical protein
MGITSIPAAPRNDAGLTRAVAFSDPKTAAQVGGHAPASSTSPTVASNGGGTSHGIGASRVDAAATAPRYRGVEPRPTPQPSYSQRAPSYSGSSQPSHAQPSWQGQQGQPSYRPGPSTQASRPPSPSSPSYSAPTYRAPSSTPHTSAPPVHNAPSVSHAPSISHSPPATAHPPAQTSTSSSSTRRAGGSTTTKSRR